MNRAAAIIGPALTAILVSCTTAYGQSDEIQAIGSSAESLKPLYAGSPCHREIAKSAFQLAIAVGFADGHQHSGNSGPT